MSNFDIEAYIDGSLSPDDRMAFEAEILRNPELAREIRLMQQLAEDLQMQLLREHVTRSIGENRDGKKNLWLWIGLPALLLLLCTAGYFLFFHGQTSIPTSGEMQDFKEPQQQGKETIPENSGESIPDKTPVNKPIDHHPIAQIEGLPNPRYPAPYLRGADERDSVLSALLDHIWYMDFPPKGARFAAPYSDAAQLLRAREFAKAMTRLTLLERNYPGNDTLNFLKGYCLLELGQGDASLRYTEAAKGGNPSWAAHREWYRALALLMTGKKDAAKTTLKSIRTRPAHPFQQYADKALGLMH